MGMVSGKAALRAGSQRLVLRVGVVAEWPSDDPCDDVNQVPSCAMLVVSLAMPATPGTSSFITLAGFHYHAHYGAERIRHPGNASGSPGCRSAGCQNAEAVYGCRPAQVGHARVSFLLLRRSTTSAESATRLECVTTITHLPS